MLTRPDVITKHVMRLMLVRDTMANEGARNSTYGRMALNSLELTIGLMRQWQRETSAPQHVSQGGRMAEGAK